MNEEFEEVKESRVLAVRPMQLISEIPMFCFIKNTVNKSTVNSNCYLQGIMSNPYCHTVMLVRLPHCEPGGASYI